MVNQTSNKLMVNMVSANGELLFGLIKKFATPIHSRQGKRPNQEGI